jgi:hypothetical protein
MSQQNNTSTNTNTNPIGPLASDDLLTLLQDGSQSPCDVITNFIRRRLDITNRNQNCGRYGFQFRLNGLLTHEQLNAIPIPQGYVRIRSESAVTKPTSGSIPYIRVVLERHS